MGLAETKSQQGKYFTRHVGSIHALVNKAKKVGKVIMRKVATSREKVRLIMDNKEQDPFQFVSVWL